VTSGFDRIYPPGLMVGRVISVEPGSGLLKSIRVQPSARFDRLEEVLVVRHAARAYETPQSVR
jgi:rod shape-determining protein MreC